MSSRNFNMRRPVCDNIYSMWYFEMYAGIQEKATMYMYEFLNSLSTRLRN